MLTGRPRPVLGNDELPTSRLVPIEQIAHRLRLGPAEYDPIGAHGAKIKLGLLENPAFPPRGKLILVTSITPSRPGEGKTVVSIGLAQGLERIGSKAIVTSREPSLGPVFGAKGGAAGGGRSRLEPNQKINLHFHGDSHAISAAHNLLAALIDSDLFFANSLDFDPAQIAWPRTLDSDDRALRRVILNVGSNHDGANREAGFVITAASEIMAIVGLASSRADLRRRLEAIVVGVSRSGTPITAARLRSTGALLALLEDAMMPNLVQTTEGTPALVHTGPFANVAQGTASILAHRMGVRLADYVVNECGFGADLGVEKYVDIVMRTSGIRPAAAILVVSTESLRAQGGGKLDSGFANLEHHLRILRAFGLPLIVAINRFPGDRPEELETVATECSLQGVACALVEAHSRGGEGAVELAHKVLSAIETNPDPEINTVYALEDSLETKILKVAIQVYGADGVTFSENAKARLEQFAEWGFGRLPVSIAKTQYSLTDDPKRGGAPKGWTLNIREVSLWSGAGFVVALSGGITLMPGLPSHPRAASIDIDEDGGIIGV